MFHVHCLFKKVFIFEAGELVLMDHVDAALLFVSIDLPGSLNVFISLFPYFQASIGHVTHATAQSIQCQGHSLFSSVGLSFKI